MNVSAGAVVRSVDNPAREGAVTNVQARQCSSGLYLQVRWGDGGIEFVREDEIEPIANIDDQDPYALVIVGRNGRAGDLCSNLTYVHLSG